ncbi:TPA: hypothetical protein K8163_005018 [Escherichia coli]|nr:hypothetical protein [Escherichia coli]
MKALSGSGRSAAVSHETTARGLPCPDGHKYNRSSGSARYTLSLQNNNNIRLVAVLRAACKSRQKRKSTARLCRLTAGQSAKNQNITIMHINPCAVFKENSLEANYLNKIINDLPEKDKEAIKKIAKGMALINQAESMMHE